MSQAEIGQIFFSGGHGIDVVDHGDIKRALNENGRNYIDRIFSVAESKLGGSAPDCRFWAGRLAAKEAVLKSLGLGIQDGLKLNEIEILRLDSGRPFVKLGGAISQFVDKDLKFLISISHANEFSIASVFCATQVKD